MAHGTPDYGVTSGGSTVYQLTDVGELAARLGSPITHDRRGDVIWWEDFECGPSRWSLTPVGVNSSVALSTSRARNGRSSMQLRPGDAINDSAEILHNHLFPVLSRIGFEASFSNGDTNMDLEFRLTLFDGVNVRRYWINVRPALGIQYRNAAGAYVTVATFPLTLSGHATLFNTVKLVADAVNGRYHRLIFNETTYDLSAFTPETAASAQSPILRLQVVETTLAVTPTGAFIDDIILTQNEPA